MEGKPESNIPGRSSQRIGVLAEIHGDFPAVGKGCLLNIAGAVQEAVTEHFAAADFFVPISHCLYLLHLGVTEIGTDIGNTAVEHGMKESALMIGTFPGYDPGDHDTVVVYQIQQRNRNTDAFRLPIAGYLFGIWGAFLYVRSVMNQIQIPDCPADAFLGADDHTQAPDVVQTFFALLQTLLPGDRMQRIITFIQGDAGKNVQVGAVQENPVFTQLREVPFQELGVEGRTHKFLQAAVPQSTLIYSAVCICQVKVDTKNPIDLEAQFGFVLNWAFIAQSGCRPPVIKVMYILIQ